MKISVICQYYPPEIGAPQARLSEMAHVWKMQGHDVTILTAFPNHPTGIIPPEYRKRIFMKEIRDDVTIWRHWLYATPNKGFFKKTCMHLSFMISLIFLSLFRGERPDVYVVSSPNFFSVISTYVFSRIRRVPFIFEVRDLWPGIFIDLGVLKNRYLIRILEIIELFLYKKARAVVPVTHGFAKNIIERGIPSNKVEIITNGVDLQRYRPSNKNGSFRSALGYSNGDFVVLYIGAHGISHGLFKVLDAAEILIEQKDIKFLLVGEGAVKEKLLEKAKNKKLQNIAFLPGQKKEDVAQFYHCADVCLVPLRDVPGFDAFIPSKMFEIMACGKPVIGSVRGESADILSRSQAAFVITPENPGELVHALRYMKCNPEKRQQMGKNGRIFVEKHYDIRKQAKRYLDIIKRVAHETEKIK